MRDATGGWMVDAEGTSGETVSIRYVRVLVDAVEHRSVSRACFLNAAGWDSDRLGVVEGRVPCAEFHRLCELALDLTGDPGLGLRVLQVVRLQSVDLVGQLVSQASTVRQALESQLRLHKLAEDRRRHHLSESADSVTLRYDCPTTTSARVRRFVAELHMTGSYRLLRYFARGAQPLQVSFEHEAPAYRSEYRRIFKGAERFGQAFTGIVFERGLMGASRRYHDEEMHRTLRELADCRVSRLARRVSCVDRLRDVLAGHDAPGRVTMDGVARALGMSPRSLRRRLTAEGSSYDVVVSEALANRARRMLSAEGRTIQETAYELGYSDTTAFHRAFKRWTGTTPSAWRDGTKPA